MLRKKTGAELKDYKIFVSMVFLRSLNWMMIALQIIIETCMTRNGADSLLNMYIHLTRINILHSLKD